MTGVGTELRLEGSLHRVSLGYVRPHCLSPDKELLGFDLGCPKQGQAVARYPSCRQVHVGAGAVIRFAALQFRNQAAVAFGALAVVAIVLAVTGRTSSTSMTPPPSPSVCTMTARLLPLRSPDTDGPIPSLSGIPPPCGPRLIGVFGGRRSSRRSSRPAPSAWRGLRVSPARVGWPSSSASVRCPAWS